MRLTTDPVCGMKVDPSIAPARIGLNRRAYYFCSVACVEQFDATMSTSGRNRDTQPASKAYRR